MSKIMVVDDDPKIRQILLRFLVKEGHEVITVADGAYAMKDIRKDKPDLIILDVLMPELDGCTLGYHLKFQSEYAHIPILLLTSLADRPYLAKDIAADDFMSKPFDREVLLNKVDELLKRRSIRVGMEPSGGVYPEKKKKRMMNMAIASMFILISTCVLAFFRLLNSPEVPKESVNPQQAISLMADQVFLYSVPFALAVLAYGVIALKKITDKQVL